jgi:enterochelin esterase-like enzyme
MEKTSKLKIGVLLSVLILMLVCISCGDTASLPVKPEVSDERPASAVIVDLANRILNGTPETSNATPTPAVLAKTPTPVSNTAPAAISAATPSPTTAAVVAPTPTATSSKVLPAPYAVTSPTPVAFSIKGSVVVRKFHSPVLERDMPYMIYLPPNYLLSGKRYPVLYMLHGLSGAYDEWIDYKIFETTDDLINQGKIKPMIVVLPSGDQEYWVDHANGGPQYGYYVARDVVGHIDATYRTLPNRENRAIGGHSMGGHGSLQIAFNYSSVFSVVGAHSPTLRSKSEAPDYFGDQAFYEAHDPVSLALTAPNLNTLKIWVDIGDQDKTWRVRTEELHQNLTERGIAHEWHLWPGDHGGDYWTEHLPQYLQFYSDGVTGK